MTIKEHIYAIKNIISKGTSSDDLRITNRLIQHYFTLARNMLIKRRIDKNNHISESNYQSICIPLALATYDQCTGVPSDINCQVLRSTCKLPKEIISKWDTTIKARFIDFTEIPRGTPNKTKYAKYSLTNQNSPYYFLKDEHLFLLTSKPIKTIILRGIWEDPTNLTLNCTLQSENNFSCHSQDDEFPLDSDLVLDTYKATLEALGIAYKFPEDTKGDSQDVQVRPTQD